MQDQTQLMLLQQVKSQNPTNPIRFGKLLLLLLSLKIIPPDRIATIYFKKAIGSKYLPIIGSFFSLRWQMVLINVCVFLCCLIKQIQPLRSYCVKCSNVEHVVDRWKSVDTWSHQKTNVRQFHLTFFFYHHIIQFTYLCTKLSYH